ncbi:glycerol-3-phosphate dehydrogenase (NAD(+)) [Kwoniella mangroviensis CBS 8507]|uniref:glycerol-3-phosphate dehydrogenase (NAD(+)) n=1 Tax=Kwoniella mangroviensis CBS 8507 TaxID=1296122 RepID=UPI00080D323C|nr:glycerol-3-phosphate dehydrogenase (NAD(+)) [Kwoniella mangroviensis CBS 8507]OCF63968.1 glycerol-3-phosphate dehydrogenase (NAD(+)) [Kwoniella mangroviensis CBS 8507]
MSAQSTAPSTPDVARDFSDLEISSTVTTPAATRPSSPIPAALPPSPLASGKHKICVIGSGSWGTALAKIAAENAWKRNDEFHSEVRMWVREKIVNGKPLTHIINRTHLNSRYLPDIKLPKNLVATPHLKDVVKDATLIVFVVPHQFLHTVLGELSKPGVLHPQARAISAIKGVEVNGTDIETFASLIEGRVGTPCSALSGANIALEVAMGQFCETTIGCPTHTDSLLWSAVFHAPTFRVNAVEDVNGVSLGGALKNIVALAAGFVDGLGLGGNTKAAILRIGLSEMIEFCMEFFAGSQRETFSNESAGIADLITTCYGGRNRKCAEEFAKTGQPFDVIEKKLLNGQKLQGTATAEEVHNFLRARKRTHAYPLFEKVYQISYEGLPPKALVQGL